VYDGPVIARTVGVLALAGLTFVEGRTLANDSEALLAGGEITFKKSEGITMETEDLSIKPDDVRVAYKFRNTTPADITTLVAFPLAPYEVPAEDDAENEAELRAEPRWRDLGHFTLRVDGRPTPFESTVSWSTKKATGRRNNQKIVTVTYHWVQTFPAGKVVSVEHSFHPYGGFIYSFDYAGAAALERQLAHDYCVGPVLLRAMKRGEGSLGQVHYILKTAANWNGPIGRFTLRIQKQRAADKVSVCLDGLRKVDDRTFVLEKTNYVPTQDLQIAFITLPAP
jgi:hypothetical protein